MARDLPIEAVETLVAHHRRFLDFLAPRVGSRTAAEDVLQSAFVKGLERDGDIREEESVVAWFYRVLWNSRVDFYRHRDAEARALGRHAAEVPATVERGFGLEAVVCACVHGLIPTLKEEYATILRAAEMDGRPVREVSAQLGLTPGNAAVRLHRARRALRARLEASCGTCTEHGCLDCTCKTTG